MPKKPRERFGPLVDEYGCREIFEDFGDDFGRKFRDLNLSHLGMDGMQK